MIQRAHGRYSPRSKIEVLDHITEQVMGVVINISKGGIMLLSEGNAPQAGSIYQVSMQDSDAGNLNVSLGIMCLWVDEASAPDTFWSGHQIIDISSADEEQLDDFVDSLKPN